MRGWKATVTRNVTRNTIDLTATTNVNEFSIDMSYKLQGWLFRNIDGKGNMEANVTKDKSSLFSEDAQIGGKHKNELRRDLTYIDRPWT